MMNYAIVENGLVVNVVVWDGDASIWAPAAGQMAVQLADDAYAGPGFTYDGTTFTAPPVQTP
jgi:hypothetical protein